MTASSTFLDLFDTVKATFPEAVKPWVNGTDSTEVVRSNNQERQVIDPNTGRIDPETFTVRGLIAAMGDLKTGRTVQVDEVDATILEIEPDAIGLTTYVTLRKRKISGA